MIEEVLDKIAKTLGNVPKSDEERMGDIFTQISRKYDEMAAKDVKTAAKMSEGYGADYWSLNVIEKMTHARNSENPVTDYLDAALLCVMAVLITEVNK